MDIPIITYYTNGKIQSEEYRIKYDLHRENDKPAFIEYYKNGNIKTEKYYYKNKYHRENNKPAIIY